MGAYTTQVRCHVRAPRSSVCRALLDADAIAKWHVPVGMSSHVHEFDAREGGSFRISLTYEAPDAAGKSAGRTDTYHGHFAKLVPDKHVVEVFGHETGTRMALANLVRLVEAEPFHPDFEVWLSDGRGSGCAWPGVCR
jgi:uncharacterized protein YndB with AHSA1/START domain